MQISIIVSILLSGKVIITLGHPCLGTESRNPDFYNSSRQTLIGESLQGLTYVNKGGNKV